MPEKLSKTTVKKNRGGRPTAKLQEEMASKLRNYYDMGVTAQFTSKQQGMPNEKTCEKYFRMWTEEYRETYNDDISERQKDAKARLVAVYDQLIYYLNVQLNKFTGLIIEDQGHQEFENRKQESIGKKTKPYRPNPYYEGMFKGLIKDIAILNDAKTALDMQPTIDEEHEQRILEKFKKKKQELVEN